MKRKVVVVYLIVLMVLGIQAVHHTYLPIVTGGPEVRATLPHPPPPIYLTPTATR